MYQEAYLKPSFLFRIRSADVLEDERKVEESLEVYLHKYSYKPPSTLQDHVSAVTPLISARVTLLSIIARGCCVKAQQIGNNCSRDSCKKDGDDNTGSCVLIWALRRSGMFVWCDNVNVNIPFIAGATHFRAAAFEQRHKKIESRSVALFFTCIAPGKVLLVSASETSILSSLFKSSSVNRPWWPVE